MKKKLSAQEVKSSTQKAEKPLLNSWAKPEDWEVNRDPEAFLARYGQGRQKKK